LHAVLIQAEELGIPVAQHAPHPPEGMQWQELAGLQTFEHVEDIYQGPLKYQQDQVKLDETIAELKTLGVPISGTLAIYQQLTRLSAEKSSFLNAIQQDYTSPFIRYYEKQDQVKRWLDASEDHANYNLEVMAYLLEITRQLHQQDVELVLGSDSGVLLLPIGLGTHEELALLHQSGLSPYEALKAATVNPAQVLGKSEELGQIKPGYRADFIYSYQNPTEDLSVLRYPDAVLKSGHWYDDKQLEYIRRKAINSRNIFSELWVILSNY
jgi:imidazolonepropionase-like amidohydrolase